MPSNAAPALTYPVTPSRGWACGLAGVWVAGAIVLGAWLAMADVLFWHQAVAGAALAACALAAWRGVRRFTRGDLHWDGLGWALVGRPGALAVHVDLQSALLLSLSAPRQARRWCWVERRAAPARWGDLRRAVYSRARNEASPGPAVGDAKA